MLNRRVDVFVDATGGGEMQFLMSASFSYMSGEFKPFQDLPNDVSHQIEVMLTCHETRGVVHAQDGKTYEWDLI